MKNFTHALFMAVFLLSTNNLCIGMEQQPPAAPALIAGHIIPSEYNISTAPFSISPNSLFSLFGFVVSCLGGALVYQGAQRIAEPSPLPAIDRGFESLTLPADMQLETPQTQGRWLTGQGLLLATAGVLAIFHQKIFSK